MPEKGYQPLPEDKRCSACQGVEFLLAVDKTEYTPVSTSSGGFETGSSHMETIDGPETIRFFCTACGEYYQVPKPFDGEPT